MPWPSSCASVSTSRRRDVQFNNRYGWCDGTVYAQNAPGRLPGRARRVDPRAVEEPARGVGELARERAVRVEHELLARSSQPISLSTSATDAMRS